MYDTEGRYIPVRPQGFVGCMHGHCRAPALQSALAERRAGTCIAALLPGQGSSASIVVVFDRLKLIASDASLGAMASNATKAAACAEQVRADLCQVRQGEQGRPVLQGHAAAHGPQPQCAHTLLMHACVVLHVHRCQMSSCPHGPYCSPILRAAGAEAVAMLRRRCLTRWGGQQSSWSGLRCGSCARMRRCPSRPPCRCNQSYTRAICSQVACTAGLWACTEASAYEGSVFKLAACFCRGWCPARSSEGSTTAASSTSSHARTRPGRLPRRPPRP